MIYLENGDAKVKISEIGAELKSFNYKGVEYIWQGDENTWEESSPILFPICGGLKDDEFILNNKTYSLKKHGYARFCNFKVESADKNATTFLLKSNAESRAHFPFNYELRVTFALKENVLSVKYDVKNLSDDTMYFSIGAHEGYNCPEGIEDYDVIFPQNETLNSNTVCGSLMEHNTIPIIENSDRIKLDYKYFSIDALIFKDLKSRSATLKNRVTERAIKVDFDGFDYFLLWTIPGASYICMEPWCGMPDSVDSNKDITQKEGIVTVEGGNNFSRTHSISILED